MTKRKSAKPVEIEYEAPIALGKHYNKVLEEFKVYAMETRNEGENVLYIMDSAETQVVRLNPTRKTAELSDKVDKIFKDEIRDLMNPKGFGDEETEDDLSVLEEY